MKSNSVSQKRKSPMEWTWIFAIIFFVLGLWDIRLSLLALACMVAPLAQVIRGKGKVHCQLHCPRGSFYHKWVGAISMNGNIPEFMKTHWFKRMIMVIMFSLFGIGIIQANGDAALMGYALYRLIVISTIVGSIMGVFFKPRTWCTVCPMGYSSTLLDKAIKSKEVQNKESKKKIA